MTEQIAIAGIVYLLLGLATGIWLTLGRLDYLNSYLDGCKKLDDKPYDAQDRIVLTLLIIHLCAFIWPWFFMPNTDQS